MVPPIMYGRLPTQGTTGTRQQVKAVHQTEILLDVQKPRKMNLDIATKAALSESSGTAFKLLILCVLVVQNASCILLMRYSRSQPGEGDWNSQTGVIMQEVMKGIVSWLLLLREGGAQSAFEDPIEVFRSGVPAFLYLVQNNMQYVAATHLDAPSCAVLSQLKLLTTAFFSGLLLNRRPSPSQWVALVLLSVGVAIVATSQLDGGAAAGDQPTEGAKATSYAFGVMALLLATLNSGLASVYFEKTLKTSPLSMWARNLQMSFFSVAIGVVGLVSSDDWQAVSDRGFFHGYTHMTWVTISNNVFGGLLVAMAIKYADSIVKNFSTSTAIVFTSVMSSVLFKTPISWLFGLGAAFVIYAVLLYGGMGHLTQFGCWQCCGRPPRREADKSPNPKDEQGEP
mmetsp:Transcript_861/g.2720  ORF Transcript_861/g.2720 Transcript_861/m.2720 type:complete len:397 (+) Transcript_861:91-1281(+)